MMAALFLLFVITMILIWTNRQREALILSLVTLLLTLAVFWHHITTILDIRL
jgi:hypothetical protein